MYENFSLLEYGKTAFVEIINNIRKCRKNIYIKIFIWRDDVIGNKIAKEILEAANRGIKITIVKDRYGLLLEEGEESRKSLFHKNKNLIEKIELFCLKTFYHRGIKVDKSQNELYEKIIAHPNITISKDKRTYDHTKLYIFDDETIIMGGINIEDKENGMDSIGRIYHDLMLKIVDKNLVMQLQNKLNNSLVTQDTPFVINLKRENDSIWEIEKTYIDLIKHAKKEVTIVMPYFAPIKSICLPLIDVAKNGVNVKIIIPASANYTNDLNRKTIRYLMKKTNNKIDVYLCSMMVHTKLILSDNTFTFGSGNINKQSFKILNELNIKLDLYNDPFSLSIKDVIKNLIEKSEKVKDYKEIMYSKGRTLIEDIKY